MHFAGEFPDPTPTSSRPRTEAPKTSFAKALKNKITGVIAKPVNAYYDRKVKKHEAEVNKDVGMIKDYRAMRDSGSSVTQTPEFRKAADNYAALKNKYNK